ncbi:MAG: HAD hydrolase-like protein, partial [Finegoldia magna]
MKIRGIIFDKDGTLMEFSDLWQCAVEELFNEYSLSEEVKEEIREKIGIKSDLTIRENSILASGTMNELFEVISMYILNSEDEI